MKLPKHKLKYTHFRKDRKGEWQPFCVFTYWDGEKYKRLEKQLLAYTIEHVVLARQAMRVKSQIKLNKSFYGVATENIKYVTFDEVVEKWLEYKTRTLRSYTVKRYKSIIDNHIKPDFEELPISSITRQRIQDLVDLTADKKQTRTAQFIHSILSNLFKFAVKREYLEKNPFTEIDYPKHKAREIESLSQPEAKQFLKLIKSSKHALMFELALITGMRPEEYFALRWNDIDLQKGVVFVRQSLNLNMPETVEFQGVKSKNSRRKLPLSTKLIANLKKHKKAQAEKKKPKNYHDLNLVFCAENGKPLRLNNITNRHFKPIIEKITDKRIHLYSLRHSTATLLLLAGENPKTVAERLGNSVSITLSTYSHVTPNLQKSASEKLEKMLG